MIDPLTSQQARGDAFALTRRHFVRDCSMGLGAMALASLSAEDGGAPGAAAGGPLAARDPHFAPSVKNVIFLHMAGSPPHLDLFDYKPELVKHNGEPCPKEKTLKTKQTYIAMIRKALVSRFSTDHFFPTGSIFNGNCHIVQWKILNFHQI